MCGVVGVDLSNPSKEQIEMVEKIILETEIRGKHASGISWYTDKLNMIKDGIPISELMGKINIQDLVYNNTLKLICHIRYSTSDIHYHQPLGSEEDMFIVHNGVISQEPPEKWEELYGYSCSTKNDSELIYHALKENKNIYEYFGDVSISALSLDKYGNLVNYRNGLRPQWKSTFNNGVIYTSTRDIAIRGGVPHEIMSKVIPAEERTHRILEKAEMTYLGEY